MNLPELLTDFVSGNIKDIECTGLAIDSRAVKTGDVFIALNGAHQHGLLHVNQAITNGAIAVLFEPTDNTHPTHAMIPFIAVNNLSAKLGDLAARFYGHPSHKLSVIGITGTNGKTSCSQFLAQALNDCGIIGTLGWGEWGELQPTANTTPSALAIQQMLADFVKRDKQTVAMEVSSHGLAQSRVNGVRFTGAVFTNLTRDHLDYHGTMAEYLAAKLTLFRSTDLAFAVINLDDAYSHEVLAVIPPAVCVWGISTQRQHNHRINEWICADNIHRTLDGITLTVRWREQEQLLQLPLYGDFNIENGLCVLAVLLALGFTLAQAANRLMHLKPVIGRMERIINNPLVFVDYAHTPSALANVLRSVRSHCAEKVWVVFGCGGNRDKGKRPQMGEIAERYADHVIITDDNPRFEHNADIVQDILGGCHSATVIYDRALAIQTAITHANPNDCVVIAGKGHEDYQEINGERLPFSDQHIAQTLNAEK